RCALVLLVAPGAAAPGASPLVAEGVWEGYILDAPRGAGGFGYDPYFWLPDRQLTVAQLSTEDKNRLSHRGKAMRALRTALLARIGERC
ncbi:MAG: XTP/dITP diphosphohydrolase, partial [Gammaproteobacteria bacterium]|nr:XTP/dITP diphosphohydrolase [Gammaproteobacteria bacterium]